MSLTMMAFGRIYQTSTGATLIELHKRTEAGVFRQVLTGDWQPLWQAPTLEQVARHDPDLASDMLREQQHEARQDDWERERYGL